MIIHCSGEELVLCKERAVYWKRERMLIISDLHLGKAAHFRKSGIQVPSTVGLTDLENLSNLLEKYEADILLITGDMFHNYMNSDVQDFKVWRISQPALRIVLVKGNHDGLSKADYDELGIEVHDDELIIAPFRFMHDRPEINDQYYTFSGHIHPGITIHGRARQQIRLACFCISENRAVLPAFSVFTGLSMIKPGETDCIYAISPGGVVKV